MDLNEMFASFYDVFYYKQGFCDDIYEEQLYSTLGLTSVILSAILLALFYFIINRPFFSKWYHWLTMLVINIVLTFMIGYYIVINQFNNIGIAKSYDTTDYVQFNLVYALVSIFYFIIITYSFKWWYGNAKGTPKLFLGKF